MLRIEKIYPRDIIALVVLTFSLVLIAMGINSLVSGIVIMIITFYFVRRFDGEGEPERDLNKRVEKIENGIKKFPKQIINPQPGTPGFEPELDVKYTHQHVHAH